MTILDELINSADLLCEAFEKAAENEKKFCYDVCLEFERYSWETYKLANEIRSIKEMYGEPLLAAME